MTSRGTHTEPVAPVLTPLALVGDAEAGMCVDGVCTLPGALSDAQRQDAP
ncbi:MAG: hypothetical protein WA971_09165 [Microbacterium sp.]